MKLLWLITNEVVLSSVLSPCHLPQHFRTHWRPCSFLHQQGRSHLFTSIPAPSSACSLPDLLTSQTSHPLMVITDSGLLWYVSASLHPCWSFSFSFFFAGNLSWKSSLSPTSLWASQGRGIFIAEWINRLFRCCMKSSCFSPVPVLRSL